tara:strand:+ start:35 stop:454 length:420 start_codon:yes stop_codon:yes gene_type:complete
MERKYSILEIMNVLTKHDELEDIIKELEETKKNKLSEIDELNKTKINNHPDLIPDPDNQLTDLETQRHIFYPDKVWSKLTSKYLTEYNQLTKGVSRRGPKPKKTKIYGIETKTGKYVKYSHIIDGENIITKYYLNISNE